MGSKIAEAKVEQLPEDQQGDAQMRMLTRCAREIHQARKSRDEWREEIEVRLMSPANEVCAAFARHLIAEDDAARP